MKKFFVIAFIAVFTALTCGAAVASWRIANADNDAYAKAWYPGKNEPLSLIINRSPIGCTGLVRVAMSPLGVPEEVKIDVKEFSVTNSEGKLIAGTAPGDLPGPVDPSGNPSDTPSGDPSDSPSTKPSDDPSDTPTTEPVPEPTPVADGIEAEADIPDIMPNTKSVTITVTGTDGVALPAGTLTVAPKDETAPKIEAETYVGGGENTAEITFDAFPTFATASGDLTYIVTLQPYDYSLDALTAEVVLTGPVATAFEAKPNPASFETGKDVGIFELTLSGANGKLLPAGTYDIGRNGHDGINFGNTGSYVLGKLAHNTTNGKTTSCKLVWTKNPDVKDASFSDAGTFNYTVTCDWKPWSALTIFEVEVTTAAGGFDVANVDVPNGNTSTTITLTAQPDGAVFEAGKTITVTFEPQGDAPEFTTTFTGTTTKATTAEVSITSLPANRATDLTYTGNVGVEGIQGSRTFDLTLKGPASSSEAADDDVTNVVLSEKVLSELPVGEHVFKVKYENADDEEFTIQRLAEAPKESKSSSGGGCDAGFGMIALLAAGWFVASKARQ